MNSRPDIVVYGPDERLLLVAEVKNIRDTSPDWAAKMRRNLLVHGIVPNAPFFLLALPDHFYLWKDGKSMQDTVPPDYEVETAVALGAYTERLGIPLEDLSEPSLELLVTSWLHDLIDFGLRRDEVDPSRQWLFDSGLYEAIKNGSVVTEAVV